MSNFQVSLHPFFKCHTGQKIIIELSKLLECTGYMVVLPEVESNAKVYYIACTNQIKSSNTDGRFVVFVGGQYGIAAVSSLKPDLDKTNWTNYGENLIKLLKNELFEGEKKFLNGTRAISVIYQEGLVIPQVGIVSAEMKIKI